VVVDRFDEAAGCLRVDADEREPVERVLGDLRLERVFEVFCRVATSRPPYSAPPTLARH
jgi:hypothetical protein